MNSRQGSVASMYVWSHPPSTMASGVCTPGSSTQIDPVAMSFGSIQQVYEQQYQVAAPATLSEGMLAGLAEGIPDGGLGPQEGALVEKPPVPRPS